MDGKPAQVRFWSTVIGWVALLTALAVFNVTGDAIRAADPAKDSKPAAESKPATDSKPAANDKAAPASATKAAPATKEELSHEQQQIAEKYRRFEEVILRMAELTAGTDPKRAALLRRAAAQSKEHLVGLQLEKLSEVIRKGPLGTAVRQQTDVEQELDGLLQLLLTEQRQDRVKEERERLKQQIRKIKELINRQTEIKGQTEGDADAKQLSPNQQRLADEAAKLAQEMKAGQNKPGENKPAGDAKPADGKPSDGDAKNGEPKEGDSKSGDKSKQGDKPKDDTKSGEKKADDKSADKKPGDEKLKDDKPAEGKPGDKPTDAKNGERSDPKDAGKPSEGKPSEGKSGEKKSPSGKPQEGQPGEGDPSEGDQKQSESQEDSQSPGQKRVATAQQKMEQAKKKLDDAKKDGAKADQEEAIRELEKAKAELEAILRQLREEELARTLAQLEQRFREMLAMQHEVYEGTQRLDKVPADKRTSGDEVESGRLSRKESLILAEAEKALALLRDEGTAVAFPEAVEMIRDDMQNVVGLLARFKVDSVTLGVEEDIIAALEEMIAALQKAQQQQQQRQQQQQQQGGQPSEPPLVDQLAELKMIRALQMRVNTRTKRYQKLVDGPEGQADKPELLDAIKDLAEREQRIYHTTRDIVVGKNK